jgi:putative ABC transport system permease protein
LKLKHLLKRTPIAWAQVTHQPVKLLVALAGICFSNILMFFQLGLMDSLYNSQTKPIELLCADMVMVSSKYVNMVALINFNRNRLYQVLGVDGVDYVTPLRLGRSKWRNPDTRKTYDIFVFGINPAHQSLAIPEIEQSQARLTQLRTALFDRNSKPEYGNVAQAIEKNGEFLTESQNRELKIIDTFALGATFAADSNLIVSSETFLYLFPDIKPNQIQMGLIKLKDGANPEQVKATMQAFLSSDVQVLTKKEYSNLELRYWEVNSSIGFIFGLGILVGFMVGAIIVYQILYAEVTNSLAQYATLKAMGYTDGFVISIVIHQSAILAFIGFFPGVALSMWLYNILAEATKLSIYMTFEQAILVLVLTFIMCVGSGTLATRRLMSLDPADVF